MNDAADATPGTGRVMRIVLASGVLPLAIAAIGAMLVRSWRDDLPARIAVHWGTSGANDFASVTTTALIIAVFGVVFTVIGLTLSLLSRDDPTLTRVSVGMTAGTTAFVTALVVGLTSDQRGLTDPADAEVASLTIIAAIAIAVLGAGLAIMIIPRRARSSGSPAPDAPRTAVGTNEQAMWTRSIAAGSAPVVLMATVVAVTAAVSAVSGQWVILVITVIGIAFLALLASTRVTVDRRGLTVKGALGWPKWRTSISDIKEARVADIRPIRHFGGYGFRIAAFGPHRGAKGIILRGGEGIVVERTDGSRMVVVVDDAQTAAGLINTLVERSSSRA